MENNVWKKGLVLAIIALFVGASVTPSISGNVFEQNTSIGTSENIYDEDINIDVNDETYSIPLIIFIKDEIDNSLRVASAEVDLDWSNIGYWGGGSWSAVPGHSYGTIHAGDQIKDVYGTIELRWIPTDSLIGSWSFGDSETKLTNINTIRNSNTRIVPEWTYSDGGNIISTAVSASGSYIVVKTSYNIHLFHRDSNTPIWSRSTGNNMGWVSISSDASYIAASAYNQLRFYNLAGTLLWSYSISGFINALSMSSDGEYIVIGGYDSHMVYLFHKDSSTPLWTFTTDGEVWSVDISSDGNYLAAGCYYDHKLYFFHKSSSTPQWYYISDDYFSAESVALSSNGDYITAGDTAGVIYLFQDDDSTPQWTYSTGSDYIRGIDISSGGNYIAVGSASPNNLYFFQKDSSNPQWIYTGATDNYYEICMSYFGHYFAGGCDSGDKHIYYFSKDSITPIWSYQTGGYLWTVSMSLNGEYIAGGGSDKNLYFFNYELPLQRPVADFTWAPLYPNPGNVIVFNASTSYDPDGNITEYRWDFDMDGIADATGQTANNTWNDYGIYSVALLVIDDSSFIDYIIKDIIIGHEVDDFRYIWIYPSPEKLYMHHYYNIDLIVINTKDIARNFVFGLNRTFIPYSVLNEPFYPDFLNENYTCYLNNGAYEINETISEVMDPGEIKEYQHLISNRWNWIPEWDWTRLLWYIPNFIPVTGDIISILFDLITTASLTGLSEFVTWIPQVPRIEYSYEGLEDSNPYSNGMINVWAPPEKRSALGLSMFHGIMSSAWTFVGWLVFGLGPWAWLVSLIAWICEAMAIVQSESYYIMATDPDSNYTEIISPEPPYLPIPQNMSSGQKQFVNLIGNLTSMSVACTKSYAKYLGALDARSSEWATIQLDATKYYINEQLNISQGIDALYDTVFPEIPPITPENISDFKNNLTENGLPEIEIDILQHYGFTDNQLDNITQTLISANDSFYYCAVENLTFMISNYSDSLDGFLDNLPDVPAGILEAGLGVEPNTMYPVDIPNTITCYIEFENVTDLTNYHIDSSLLNNQIQPTYINQSPGDHDGDGIDDFAIEFDGYEVYSLFGEVGEKMLSLTGNVSLNTTKVVCNVTIKITKTVFYSGSSLISIIHDDVSPIWRDQGQYKTNILLGESILLYAQGGDNFALDWAWLVTNETGEWKNYSSESGWFNPNWSVRKKIVINHAKVYANLSNFPVLVSFTSADLTKAQDDGDDFIFVSEENSTQYVHEIERYDSNTGELISWINVTSLSSTEDTVLYLYYGNTDCGNQENVEATWDSNFGCVQHMDDATSTSISDSTSNGNIGTKRSATEPMEVDGLMGKAQQADGANDYIVFNDADSLETGVGDSTLEAWIKTSQADDGYIWGADEDGSLRRRLFCFNPGSYGGRMYAFIRGTTTPAFSRAVGTTHVNDNQWHYAVMRIDNSEAGTSNDLKIYIDGLYEASVNESHNWDGSTLDNGGQKYLMNYINKNAALDGLLDEFRFSKCLRSDAWINTSYNTMNSPSTFVSVGPEEYGSPLKMQENDQWQWSNFTWQNSSIPVGTVVGWRIYYVDTSGNVNCTDIMNFTIIADTVPPEISDVQDYPDPQEGGGYVNITCTVADNAMVDIVTVNITGPAGFIPVNVSMINIPGTDTYCYNSTYTNTGTYNYFIWANDTNRNTNTSATYTFTIQDTTLPEILDNTPSIGYTSDPFTFNATITDNTEVPTVWVEYWYGTGSHTNVSMNNVAGDYWEKTIVIDDALDLLHYIISANDTSNNWNNTGVKDVTISDNDGPEITDVQAVPSIQNIGGYINISAMVTDNIEVDEVYLYIEYPNGIVDNVNLKQSDSKSITTKRDTIENFSITQNKTGDTYYCNKTYYQPRIYTYHIWTNDTSGNHNVSADFTFEIINQPPYTPSNPTPPDGATNVSIGVVLNWTGGDPDPGDTVTYDVYFGSMPPLPKVSSNQSGTLYVPGILDYQLTYFWTIVAWDNHGVSAEGPTWSFTTEEAPNQPPNKPNIDGPTSGKAGTSYPYTFTSTDPDGDDVSYYIDWGDGDITNWTAFQASGPPGYGESHTWSEKDTYTIRAKAKDTNGAESDWAELDVSMPMSQQSQQSTTLFIQFLQKLIQRFPVLEQMLSLSPMFNSLLNLQ